MLQRSDFISAFGEIQYSQEETPDPSIFHTVKFEAYALFISECEGVSFGSVFKEEVNVLNIEEENGPSVLRNIADYISSNPLRSGRSTQSSGI